MSTWIDVWESTEYRTDKFNNFNRIDAFLKTSPKQILDIGCGYAFESEMFQQKYQTELFLLDSTIENTINVPRQTNYGPAEHFSFYNTVNTLTQSFDSRKMSYTFLDANILDIKSNIKFDLIYSFLSCGFHYPAVTYKNLIIEHSTKDTIIILDLREKHLKEQLKDINIVNVIHEGKKHITAQIQLL
jgi:SAM-dependent methyltransferase